MTIGEILKYKDKATYYKLIQMFKQEETIDLVARAFQVPSQILKKEIELGCSVEELMRSDSYRRERGKLKQRGWR